MPTLPQMEVIARHPNVTVQRGYHDLLGLNIFIHEYIEKDEQGRASFACFITDRPAHEISESPALGYGNTPQEAFEEALKDYGYDLEEVNCLECGYDPRQDGGNYVGATYVGNDDALAFILLHDPASFDWVDRVLLLVKHWQYPHLKLM